LKDEKRLNRFLGYLLKRFNMYVNLVFYRLDTTVIERYWMNYYLNKPDKKHSNNHCCNYIFLFLNAIEIAKRIGDV